MRFYVEDEHLAMLKADACRQRTTANASPSCCCRGRDDAGVEEVAATYRSVDDL